MKGKRKLLVASLGVAATAYGCNKHEVVPGNLMPVPADAAQIAPTEDAQIGPPPPRQITDVGKDAQK